MKPRRRRARQGVRARARRLRRRAAEDALGEDRAPRGARDRARRGSGRHVLGREPGVARRHRRQVIDCRGENLCGSRLPRSTPSSATSTATATASSRRIDEARERRRRSRRLPRARRDGLSAGGPPAPPGLRPRGRATAAGEIAQAARGIVALVGDAARRRRRSTTRARSARTARCRPSTASASCPNYGVFDEKRYFAPGADVGLLGSARRRVGLTVCEDLWQPGPPATESARGRRGRCSSTCPPRRSTSARTAEREEMFAARARDNGCAVVFCNAVGGQDELVFDGHSFVLDDAGEVVARAPGLRGGAARRRPRRSTSVPAPDRRATRRARADAARARARSARLRREERLPRRRRRPLGRHRLGADRCARRRGARSRSACTACRCRRASRPTRRARMPRLAAESLGVDFREIPIEHDRRRRSRTRSRRASPGSSATRPRRTSRRARAARC